MFTPLTTINFKDIKAKQTEIVKSAYFHLKMKPLRPLTIQIGIGIQKPQIHAHIKKSISARKRF